MRNDIIVLLDKNPDYFIFLREHPIWHKRLSYAPSDLKEFIDEYKTIRRKRVVDKLEDFSMMINLAKELM